MINNPFQTLSFFRFTALAVLLFMLEIGASAQNPIGTWTAHLPQKNATCVAQSEASFIYVGTERGLFSYNKSTGEIRSFSTVNGLSELSISALSYFKNSATLLIAYESGNIDLMQGNQIINVSDIERSGIIGDKRILNVLPNVDPDTGDEWAYLSTSFGVVVLNITKKEVVDTYVLGEGGEQITAFQTALDSTHIYVASEIGLRRAERAQNNLSDFNNWETVAELPEGACKQVVNVKGIIWATVDETFFQQSDTDWTPQYGETGWCIKQATVYRNQLVFVEWSGEDCDQSSQRRITYLNSEGEYDQFEYYLLSRPMMAMFDNVWGTIWVADYFTGLIRLLDFETVYEPEGPASADNRVIELVGNDLWIASGKVTTAFNALFSRVGYFHYDVEGNDWTNYSFRNVDIIDENQMTDFIDVVKHPTQNKIYLASYSDGVLEYDLDTEEYTLYNASNSSLQEATGDAEGVIRASGLKFDQFGNLWVSNYLAPRPISVMTPEGEWHSFLPTVSLVDNGLRDMEIDDLGQRWVIHNRNGILVFNNGADFTTEADDRYVLLKTNYNIPDNEVLSIKKDLNGAMWIGTTQGAAAIYCPTIFFDNPCNAVKPRVTVEGIIGYLLETESILAIEVDGANRKWFGTENGLFVMNEDGTEQVNYFNVDNSPLPSNIVNSLKYNGVTGEMHIGTAAGLMTYQSDAITGTTAHADEISVYPNPVRSDYDGPIAMRGLARNARVKITDVAGNLVYEMDALGGQAIWDGRDYTGRKAAPGVYLIFSTNSDGSDSKSGKFALMR